MCIRDRLKLELKPYSGSFDDVLDGVWFTPYIEALSDAGVVSGDGKLFRPNDVVSPVSYTHLASFTAFPDTWERVSANEGDIAVVEDPKDADNQCLLLDNSTSGAETKVTVKLPEPVKATAENPIVIAEYRFMNTVGLVNLMYLYGGANGSSIPVNMNIYNDYAYAQTSEGNETFLRPWVADTWYTVRVELDNSTKRFDLYLDGELKLENRPFRIAGADSVSSFLIARTENRNGKVYYDDFKVYADPYYLLDSAVNSIVTENLESITGALSLPQTAGGLSLIHI